MDKPQKKVLVLDLEETIIDAFPSCEFHGLSLLQDKVDFIRGFNESHQWEEIWILSFAIWNREDITLFNTMLRDNIEKVS